MRQQPFNQLTPHLWATQSRLYDTNSGIFLSQGQACLIDPGIYPDEIAAIARFVTGQGATPHTLILTHSHWDHILGPERFPGVKTIAQANYLIETSGESGARIRREIADWEAEHRIGRERPFVIPIPDETFEETMTLTVGGLTLRLVHTPGHAADQLVVYHPGSATLWAADILSDLEIPFVSYNLAAYEQTLAMLSTWEVGILVPGHGQPTTDSREIQARFAEDLAYLAELRGRVERAIRQRKTIAETVADCAEMRYRQPEDNAGPHRLNVESVYLELGGQADPTQGGRSKDRASSQNEAALRDGS